MVLNELNQSFSADSALPQPNETVELEGHEYDELGQFQVGDYDFNSCPAYSSTKVTGR